VADGRRGVSVGVLQELVPEDFRVIPRFIYPIFLLCFLGVLILGDPGRIDRQRRWLRVTTLLMIGLITVVTAAAAVRLVAAGSSPTPRSPPAGQLLIIGGCIWLTNVIAFALWYWDLLGSRRRRGCCPRRRTHPDRTRLHLPRDDDARVRPGFLVPKVR
jgi:hypothetical protein